MRTAPLINLEDDVATLQSSNPFVAESPSPSPKANRNNPFREFMQIPEASQTPSNSTSQIEMAASEQVEVGSEVDSQSPGDPLSRPLPTGWEMRITSGIDHVHDPFAQIYHRVLML